MRVGVIGAGLAGLACGCELADAGHVVTLLERRPWAGGKAYSFVDEETGAEVDNGQHVFMGCTTVYVDFLRRLGTLGLTRRQRRLSLTVLDPNGRRSVLAAAPLPPPLHPLPSFARYSHLSAGGKLRVARTMLRIYRLRPDEVTALDGVTFADWLRQQGQSATAIRDFWDLIVTPSLNCPSAEASAAAALFVFREGLLPSAEAAAIGIPAAGLSRLHVEPALRYIEARGGVFLPRAGIEAIEVADGAVSGVRLASGELRSFDAYVSALPPEPLVGLLPPDLAQKPPFDGLAYVETAAIVNLHLWFDGPSAGSGRGPSAGSGQRPVAGFDFAAFVRSDLQWLFNRSRIGGEPDGNEHLVISLSAADRYLELDRAGLLAMLLPQLERALPAARGRRLVQSTLIKEPQATFKPLPDLRRPGPETPLANLFLAGAYTDTGWPATMESAVRSGLAAAAAVRRNEERLEAAALVA